MTRTGALPALAVAVLLIGCETTTAPEPPVASPGAAAWAVTSNDPGLPFLFEVITCEEEVIGSGILHVLSRTTISSAEDTITALHINARGTGVGSTSGAQYRFNDTFRVSTNQISGLPLLVSFTDVLNLIGKGSVTDLHVRTTFRMVVNSEGIQTVLVDEVRFTCG
jgi:hypothetical protein